MREGEGEGGEGEGEGGEGGRGCGRRGRERVREEREGEGEGGEGMGGEGMGGRWEREIMSFSNISYTNTCSRFKLQAYMYTRKVCTHEHSLMPSHDTMCVL